MRRSTRSGTVPAGVEDPPGLARWDGILNIHKPAGWTSHDVVAKLRGILKGPRVGHAGTLDPAATGVLPVLVGRATRIAAYLMDWEKEYRAVLRIGETTDTQDATGMLLQQQSIEGLSEESIRQTVAQFQGRIAQVPPMYSAVKVKGVPLYKAARAGRTVDRGPRQVVVHKIEVEGVAGCDVMLRVVCSKGTYVRTLCADIGEALGVGGHLLSLHRTRVGPLLVEGALTIEEVISKASRGSLAGEFITLDLALEAFPALFVDQLTASRVLHGVTVPPRAARWEAGAEPTFPGQTVRLKDAEGRLLALGRIAGEGPGTDHPAEWWQQEPVKILKVLADVEGAQEN
ncbi:MAG: tRNA pseudouridine(55) synthase TruB [Nitrospiraceae bacterium]